MSKILYLSVLSSNPFKCPCHYIWGGFIGFKSSYQMHDSQFPYYNTFQHTHWHPNIDQPFHNVVVDSY
jgi:hypothetical protein